MTELESCSPRVGVREQRYRVAQQPRPGRAREVGEGPGAGSEQRGQELLSPPGH